MCSSDLVTAGCIESPDNNPIEPVASIVLIMQFSSDGSISSSDEFASSMADMLAIPPASLEVLEFGMISSGANTFVAIFEVWGHDEPESAKELAGMVASADPELAAHGFYNISLKEVADNGLVLATVKEPVVPASPKSYDYYEPVGAASLVLSSLVTTAAALWLSWSFVGAAA